MAIEAKDLLELIGAEQEFETIDEAKTAFHDMWVAKAMAHKDKDIRSKVAGEVLGSAETQVKRLFALQGEDLKGKKVEDLIQIAADNAQKQLEEAKAKGGKTDDEKDKALAEAVKRHKEEEALRMSLAKQLEDKDAEFATKLKQSELTKKLTEIKSQVPFAKDLPSVSKLGFETMLSQKYNFDLDEKGEVLVTDKEGNQIQNAAKTAYMKADELIKSEAAKENLIAKSNGQGAEPKTEKFNQEPANGATKRQMHPNAIAAV